ncbi:unnamed protein product, partial [Prorocentrum cordatum]
GKVLLGGADPSPRARQARQEWRLRRRRQPRPAQAPAVGPRAGGDRQAARGAGPRVPFRPRDVAQTLAGHLQEARPRPPPGGALLLEARGRVGGSGKQFSPSAGGDERA